MNEQYWMSTEEVRITERYNILKLSLIRAAQAVIDIKRRGGFRIEEKEGSRNNMLTEADMKSGEVIRTVLKQLHDDELLSEEGVDTIANPRESKQLWILDEIDGTRLFITKTLTNWGITLAYAERGRLILGGIILPDMRILVTAQKGHGTHLYNLNEQFEPVGNGAICNVVDDKSTSIIITSDTHYIPDAFQKNIQTLGKFSHTSYPLMRGSAVSGLVAVAVGDTGLYFHEGLKPWDIAGGMLLIREAGGVVRDYDGNEATFMSDRIVAGAAPMVDMFGKEMLGWQ